MKALAVFLSLFLVSLFVSCDQDMSADLAEVNLSVSREKALTAVDAGEITEYRYEAIPQFEDRNLVGATGGFVSLSSDISSPVGIGLMSQGTWRFNVQGLNSEGIVIATGTTEQTISRSSDNNVPVHISTDRNIGTGGVSFTFDTDATSASNMGLIVRWRNVDGSSWTTRSSGWTRTMRKDNSEATFSGRIDGLATGFWELHFILTDNGVYIGGESLTVQIVSGKVSTVSGTILPSKQMTVSLSITSPGFIKGTLGSDVTIHKNPTVEKATLKWTNTTGYTVVPDSFVWMVDGEVKSSVTGDTLEYLASESDGYGDHQISVIAIRHVGSGSSSREMEIGSSTVTVSVVRRTATITFNAGEGFLADGTHSTTIVQDPYESPQVPALPERAGYVFGGWYYGDAQAVTANNVVIPSVYRCEGSRTLNARWTVNTFTLRLEYGDDDLRHVTINGTTQTVVPYSKTESINYGNNLSSKVPTAVSRVGYIFKGWYTETNGRGTKVWEPSSWSVSTYTWTEDMTLYAYWIYAPITINFYIDASTSYNSPKNPKTVVIDQPYGALPEPVRQGYIFDGWYTAANGGGTKVNEDDPVRITTGSQNLYAKWTEGNIPVRVINPKKAPSYCSTHGTNDYCVANGTVAIGSIYGSLIPASNPTATGYTFLGWYIQNTNKSVVSGSTVTIQTEHVIEARWQGNSWTASFDSHGGSSCASMTVTYGEPYATASSPLPVPTRTGYLFNGWYTTSSGGTKVYGYYSDQSGSSNNAISSTVSTNSNHTLHAQWSTVTMNLTLNANGGTFSLGGQNGLSSATGTISYGVTYENLYYNGTKTGLPTPTRTGYVFNGWSYTAGGSAVTNSSTNSYTAAHSLIANWTPVSVTLNCYRNWDSSDSTTVDSRTLVYGGSYGSLPSPSRPGYELTGWFTARSAGTEVSASTTVSSTSTISIYAQWSARKINVTLDANGGTMTINGESGLSTAALEVYYGSTYSTGKYKSVTVGLPSAQIIARTGYTFSAWKLASTTVTNSTTVSTSTNAEMYQDHTLTASWAPKSVNVTLNPNGGTMSLSGTNYTTAQTLTGNYDAMYSTLKFGETTVGLPTPTKANYVFAGWYSDEQFTTEIQAGNTIGSETAHTLYARWTNCPVEVTFNWSDSSIIKTLVYNEDTYGPFPDPNKSGYAIEGWYTGANGAGTKISATDLVGTVGGLGSSAHTIYANWVSVTYVYHLDTGDCEHVYWSGADLQSRINSLGTGYIAAPGTFDGNTYAYIRNVSSGGQYTRYSGSTNTSWTQDITQTLSFTANAETVMWSGEFACTNTGTYSESPASHMVCGYHETGKIWNTCPYCNGTGQKWESCWFCDGTGTEWEECGSCNGTGQIEETHWAHVLIDCPVCEGTGSDPEYGGAMGSTNCSACGGRGKVESYQQVTVPVTCPGCNGAGGHDVDCHICSGDGGWYVTCDRYVVETCPVCGGDSIVTRTTTTQGNVTVNVAGTNRISAASGSWSGTVGSQNTVSISFSTATAPSGYPTRVGRTVSPSYTVKDPAYGNAKTILLTTAGSYTSLDSYLTGYWEKGIDLSPSSGKISGGASGTLTKYYRYPGYILRDTYISGVISPNPDQVDVRVTSGAVSVSGSPRTASKNGSSITPTSISWNTGSVTALGSSVVSWGSTEYVTSFSLDAR